MDFNVNVNFLQGNSLGNTVRYCRQFSFHTTENFIVHAANSSSQTILLCAHLTFYYYININVNIIYDIWYIYIYTNVCTWLKRWYPIVRNFLLLIQSHGNCWGGTLLWDFSIFFIFLFFFIFQLFFILFYVFLLLFFIFQLFFILFFYFICFYIFYFFNFIFPRIFQIIRCLIKPLLKNSTQTIFEGGTSWVAQLLNNIIVWMVLYCEHQLLGVEKKQKPFSTFLWVKLVLLL